MVASADETAPAAVQRDGGQDNHRVKEEVVTSVAKATDMLTEALDLAAQGWSVFPCWPTGPRGKSPMTANGHLDATTSPEQITRWWTARPDAMIGAPVPGGLLVLDIDPRNGGSLSELERVTGPLPETVTVTSGRGDGGVHLYFYRPRGEFTSTRLPKGVDLKVNGYCIVPPSLHPATGLPYVWNADENTTPAFLPDRAVAALRRAPKPLSLRTLPPGVFGTGAGLAVFVAGSPEGERNDRLFWAACRAHEGGLDTAALDKLRDVGLSVGLTEREVDRTLESAEKTAGGKR